MNPPGSKVFLVSRCAWTLFNFRRGLIESLVARGAQVTCGGAGDDGFGPNVEALGARFVALPVDRRGTHLGADLRLFWTLYRWYRRERPDVVHHFTIKPVIYGSLAARLARVPRIVNTVTGLGHVFIEGSWGLRRLVELLYRLALYGAHFTFFQNEDDRRLFQDRRLVPEARAGLLRGSGVDLERFRPPEEAPAQNEGCRFLFVGRLLREKGIHELVAAARRIKRHHPEASVQLLGRRDERNPSVVTVEELAAWEEEGVVRWLGEVTDVRDILAAADVVVLPSYREGTPRALLEAAAMGKPVIATDAVGCREAVDDEKTGLLVPVRDANALGNAMIRLIDDPDLRHRLGGAGREKMAREFDERAVVEEIVARYGMVPAAARPPSIGRAAR